MDKNLPEQRSSHMAWTFEDANQSLEWSCHANINLQGGYAVKKIRQVSEVYWEINSILYY